MKKDYLKRNVTQEEVKQEESPIEKAKKKLEEDEQYVNIADIIDDDPEPLPPLEDEPMPPLEDEPPPHVVPVKRNLYNRYKIMMAVGFVVVVASVGGYFAIKAINTPQPAVEAVKAVVVPKVVELMKPAEKPLSVSKDALLKSCNKNDLVALSEKLALRQQDINNEELIKKAITYVRETPKVIEMAQLTESCSEFLKPVAPSVPVVASTPVVAVPEPAPVVPVAPVVVAPVSPPAPVVHAPPKPVAKPKKTHDYDKKTINELNEFFKN